MLYRGSLKGGVSALLRYLPDGTLDSSFGEGGVATVNGGGPQGITAIATQPDGGIVGVAACGKHCSFEVFRLQADGSIDPSFGNGGFVFGRFTGPSPRTVEIDRRGASSSPAAFTG